MMLREESITGPLTAAGCFLTELLWPVRHGLTTNPTGNMIGDGEHHATRGIHLRVENYQQHMNRVTKERVTDVMD
jgi:hypothetical protein